MRKRAREEEGGRGRKREEEEDGNGRKREGDLERENEGGIGRKRLSQKRGMGGGADADASEWESTSTWAGPGIDVRENFYVRDQIVFIAFIFCTID